MTANDPPTMLLYSDPVFLEHETGQHPECADRLRAISEQLRKTSLDQHCSRPQWQPATLDQLALIHSPAYIDTVRNVAQRGGGRIEQDTVMSQRSFDVACWAAGAVCDATTRIVSGANKRALCLVRPPGHHALRSAAMGFCLWNNIAIAARLAVGMLQLDRVLVVDWDVHHGNGTQDTFWADPQVGFLSIHRWPFYPGSGTASETGTSDALGTICNLPVEFGTSRAEYLDTLARGLDALASRFQPQLILISAGFDSHREDPVGSLGLEVEDYAALTEIVVAVADSLCGGRIVSVLEGGYNPPVLARCVETHLQSLLETAK